ncbi:MAG TPA: lysophospholipid acyltransferase family protein [Thermoanaerobaculia bacterium]
MARPAHMTQRAIAAIVRLMAKIFFRRIEAAGVERVPASSPVIFAVNHPNALIDPVFLLTVAPRPVAFLGKAPLFRMLLIGWIVRAFDTIPVYRKQDNVSTSGNRETFARARAVLERGGAIAIFPEGTTHSDPQLRELKTGAARIALGASLRVSIVPTGLYYTAKQTFRSAALAYFGTPIVVESEPVDQNGEPQIASVEALTEKIDRALDEVTLQADSHAALELIARAERIFSAGEDRDLASELELRRQFVEGYAQLRERDPERLKRLESLIAQVDAERLAAIEPVRAGTALRLVLTPIGIIGAAIHWPLYRLIGFLATRFSNKEDAMVATLKAVGGLVLYPLFWLGLAVAAGLAFGARYGIGVLLIVPLLGYVGLISLETFDEMLGRLRAMRHHDIRAQQMAIREEILAVARELNVTSTSSSSWPADSSGS